MKTTKASLVYPIKDNYITLAIKKMKVGAGLRNGYGGRSEEYDKTMLHTALREFIEESGGLTCELEDLIPCAVISFFFFENKTDNPDFQVAFFIVKNFSGCATSTPEMEDPQPFSLNAIPYENMMPGDRLFLPKVLAGEKFSGTIKFSEDKKGVIEYDFQPTTEKNLLDF